VSKSARDFPSFKPKLDSGISLFSSSVSNLKLFLCLSLLQSNDELIGFTHFSFEADVAAHAIRACYPTFITKQLLHTIPPSRLYCSCFLFDCRTSHKSLVKAFPIIISNP
jgi:hypothetical protein